MGIEIDAVWQGVVDQRDAQDDGDDKDSQRDTLVSFCRENHLADEDSQQQWRADQWPGVVVDPGDGSSKTKAHKASA